MTGNGQQTPAPRVSLASSPSFHALQSDSRPPPWAIGVGGLLLLAALGAVWATTQGRLSELEARAARGEARQTATELEAARKYQALDGLTSEVRDLRIDVRAGFDATRVQLGALSTQITAATPQRTHP